MHIWHHTEHLPRILWVKLWTQFGIWDYLYNTVYMPSNGRDEKLDLKILKNFQEDFSQIKNL